MSKVFIQNGTGSTATLENAHNEKIPIYDTLQDAEADLTNLEENQIVATQDNGNNNRFVTQNEYKADNTYSTTETDTGKTWIDGKKIYRKVVRPTNTTGLIFSQEWAGTVRTVPFSDFNSSSGVDKILKAVYVQGGSVHFRQCTMVATGVSMNYPGYDGVGVSSSGLFVFEYTKTTD